MVQPATYIRRIRINLIWKTMSYLHIQFFWCQRRHFFFFFDIPITDSIRPGRIPSTRSVIPSKFIKTDSGHPNVWLKKTHWMLKFLKKLGFIKSLVFLFFDFLLSQTEHVKEFE